MTKNRKRVSWRIKLIAVLVVFATVPAVTVAVLALRSFSETNRESRLQSLEGLAKAKAGAIDEFNETRRRDVERMSGLIGPTLADYFAAQATAAAERPAVAPTDTLPNLADAEDLTEDAEPEGPDAPLPSDLEEPELLSPLDPELNPPQEPAEQPPGAESPLDPLSANVEAAHANLSQALGLMLGDQSVFEELLVIATDGRVIASTYREHEERDASNLEYFKRGSRATFVEPVFLSPITGELTMVVATPIRDVKNRDIGVFAARLHLERIFRLVADRVGLGESGETVVTRREGDGFVFMAPTRHDATAVNRPIEAGSPFAIAVRNAHEGETGSGEQTDYRGIEVLAGWAPVPSLGWAVVTKMDENEVTAELRATRFQTSLLTLAVVAAAVMVALFMARVLVGPLRALQDAADRISRGDFDVHLDVRTNDEVEDLADSFERMVAAIKFFRESPPEEGTDPDETDPEAPEAPESPESPR